MLTTLLTFLALQAAAPDLDQPVVAEGRCQYTEQVAKRSQDAVLIECLTVTVSRSGRSVTVDFGSPSWGPAIRLRGRLTGNRLTIEQAALHRRAFVKASGTCELFTDDGALAQVSCLARIRTESYLANFVTSRI